MDRKTLFIGLVLIVIGAGFVGYMFLQDKAEAAAKEEFVREGEAVRKEFSPEQIGSAKEALREFSGDKVFMSMATGRLSNSATLVRLLVNWAETHRGDGLPGGGAAPAQKQDFASLWRG